MAVPYVVLETLELLQKNTGFTTPIEPYPLYISYINFRSEHNTKATTLSPAAFYIDRNGATLRLVDKRCNFGALC